MFLETFLGIGGHLVPEGLVGGKQSLRLLRQRRPPVVESSSLWPRASSAARTMRQALE